MEYESDAYIEHKDRNENVQLMQEVQWWKRSKDTKCKSWISKIRKGRTMKLLGIKLHRKIL